FVLLPGDDPGYPGRFLPACRAAGVAVEELDPAGILGQEPALTRDVARAFAVPDGTLDSLRLVRACAASATASGARILTGQPVTALRRAAGRVAGATLGDGTSVEAEVVVNAAGAMLRAGDELVPGFSSAGPVRTWAAVRPLIGDPASVSGGRQASRSHRVIDHGEHDGVPGLITITGGKATTFRLMAEEAVDA